MFEEKTPKAPLSKIIQRWLRFPLRRKYDWQLSPAYWKFLQRIEIVRVSFGNIVFRVGDWNAETRRTVLIFRELLQTILTQLVLGLLLVWGLDVLERVFFGSKTLLEVLFPLNRMNSDSYVSLLGTLAQVAGIFLGLYFTAISVVAGAVYARVSVDVLTLLLREKIGNVYIRTVALLGAVSIFLLAEAILGFPLGTFNLLLVTFLGITSILSFVVLGLRIFYFFDPSNLESYLTGNLLHWIKNATPQGFQWQNPSFQAHYQRSAESALTTYRNVVELIINEGTLRSKVLVELASRLMVILQLYGEKKLSIPSDSHWFKRKYRQREWLTADDSSIRIALGTGTTIQPEVVPDLLWFENVSEEIIQRAFDTLVKTQDFASVATLENRLEGTVSSLAENYAIDEALYLLHKVGQPLLKFAHELGREGNPREFDSERHAYGLALVDLYSAMLINIVLRLSKQLRASTAEFFGNTVGAIVWNQPKTMYSAILPRATIEQLEFLKRGIDFELTVEHRPISPAWYLKQIAALSYVRFLSTTVDTLMPELEQTFAGEVKSFLNEKNSVFAAGIIQRGLEACEKFLDFLREGKRSLNSFSTLRKVPDIPWQEIGWDDFEKRTVALREQLVIAYAQTTPALSELKLPSQWPDYFGHAYSVLAEQCYTSMATGNEVI